MDAVSPIRTMKDEPIKVRILRLAGLLAVGLWGWYIAALFRTTGWGYDDLAGELLQSLAFLAVIAVPFAFLPLIGLSWTRKCATVAVFTLLTLLAVEVFGRAQKYCVIYRANHHSSRGCLEPRWWPFQDHAVGYIEGRGCGWD